MRAGGWLHDAGMEGMRFVARPGPVSPAERRVLETHPLRGHALLAGAQRGAAGHRGGDRPHAPRALRRQRLPAAPDRRGDPAGGPDRRRRRHVRRAHHRPALPRRGTVEDALVVLRSGQFDPRVVDALVDAIDDVLARAGANTRTTRGGSSRRRRPRRCCRSRPSQLRRLADEGGCPPRRTEGGHRRFLLDRGAAPGRRDGRVARAADLAAGLSRCPRLAQLLDDARRSARGHRGVRRLRRRPRRAGSPPSQAAPLLETWLARMADSCSRGRYARALTATHALMHRAQSRSAALLERHSFLERFGQVTVRELLCRGRAGRGHRRPPPDRLAAAGAAQRDIGLRAMQRHT